MAPPVVSPRLPADHEVFTSFYTNQRINPRARRLKGATSPTAARPIARGKQGAVIDGTQRACGETVIRGGRLHHPLKSKPRHEGGGQHTTEGNQRHITPG